MTGEQLWHGNTLCITLKIKNLVVLSVPHPGAFLRALLASDQLFKSYYIGLFQLPKLPELLFEKFPKIGLGLLKNSGMTKQQLEIFKTEMLEQGRLSYSLNWYRALPLMPVSSDSIRSLSLLCLSAVPRMWLLVMLALN